MVVDGIWIDSKLLIAGRKEEMEYMTKMGVFEVVDEEECHDRGMYGTRDATSIWATHDQMF